MIRFVFVCLTFFLLCSSLVSSSTEEVTEEELTFSDDLSSGQSLKNIYDIKDNCNGAVCRNFYYPSPTEIAFFDLKENIRILDAQTYEVQEPIAPDNLVFLNSTFAHFPLHLFYSISITELDMRNCSIELVTWENFLQANKLQILMLSENKLRAITESTFSYASELQYLFLDQNHLRTLVTDSFRGLGKLQHLNLANNRLKELPGLLFADLAMLRELNLGGNRLHYLSHELFARNPLLKQVILRDNRLRQLDENIFRHQQNMMFFDISHNTRLGRLILNIETQILHAANCSLYLVNLYGAVGNADLRDNQIVELYFSQPESLEKLVLRNNALQQIASLAKATNLRELDIADNPRLEYLPDPWSVNSLERLDLSNISLRMLPISNLAEQTNLRWLNVSHNKLREVNPRNFKYLEQLTHFHIDANDWNCYSLRLLMDLVIKPKGIVYQYDQYVSDFPGEYIEGIACMYRIEDSDEVAEIVSATSASSAEQNTFETNAKLSEYIKQYGGSGSLEGSYESTNQYPTSGNTEEHKLRNEIKTLRNELKAIVQHYESKFDVVFKQMQDLNQRLANFERMNETMFQHITIST